MSLDDSCFKPIKIKPEAEKCYRNIQVNFFEGKVDNLKKIYYELDKRSKEDPFNDYLQVLKAEAKSSFECFMKKGGVCRGGYSI